VVRTYRLRGSGQLEVHVAEGQGQAEAQAASAPRTTAGTATATHDAVPDSTFSCGTDAAAEGSSAAQQPGQQPLHQKMHSSQFSLPLGLIRSAFRHATSFPHPCAVHLVVNGQQLGGGAVAAELLKCKSRDKHYRMGGLAPALSGYDDVVMVSAVQHCAGWRCAPGSRRLGCHLAASAASAASAAAAAGRCKAARSPAVQLQS
jgi:hypothetical protein